MTHRAYKQAGTSPNDTAYVERMVGTGTTVGDKVEATALNEILCKGRQNGNIPLVGSSKSSVGHTESVAGSVGLIKAVLILEKKMIPPNAMFKTMNSDIPLEAWGIEVLKRMLKWPENTIRRASVNSFGYGGTNAPVILEAADDYLDNTMRIRSLCEDIGDSPWWWLASTVCQASHSKDDEALSNIQRRLAERDAFHRKLAVDVAYHSHHMELILEEYLRAIQDIKVSQCGKHIKMVSSVTGQVVRGEELNAAYWGTNLTFPVLFEDVLIEVFRTVRVNQKQGNSLAVIEIGPHSAVGGRIKQIIKSLKLSGSITYHLVLSQGQDTSRTTVGLAGDLFSKGATIDFREVNDLDGSARKRLLTNLPTYNWHHKTTHWVESRRSIQYRHRTFPKHDLLGVPSIDSIPTEPTWRHYLRVGELPWLKGHCIGGQTVFPAAGYITMVLEALKQQVLTPESSASWKEFRILSVPVNGESTEHSRGLVTVSNPSLNERQQSITDPDYLAFVEEAAKNSQVMLILKQLYKELKGLGVEYSGPFEGQ
ncbi:hypothetical protein ANOM_008348 [Aspergillus nomiae NRRL 13137]|uniref:Polyketide synthase n=1 Tax=Aspergillus nomiae NRRL (strain ATCC 15546 / NRRL 13137 / CBS 260.88 / M93) TaxID=1509407 RepID=A0A0L1IX11_ASPN3|nr:uncharacterized protein ANOM_008348 [Aspergillus nomiae NRRL 13137]KNG83930.1 hypothetical protein ANOM_008348 [Aspergillus nomiae NRRL 13137]